MGLMKAYLESVEKHWYYFAQEQESRDQSKRGLLGGRGLREFDTKLRDYAVISALASSTHPTPNRGCEHRCHTPNSAYSTQVEAMQKIVGRAEKVNNNIDKSKEIIMQSLDLILEREGVIEHLVEETENLETSVREPTCPDATSRSPVAPRAVLAHPEGLFGRA